MEGRLMCAKSLYAFFILLSAVPLAGAVSAQQVLDPGDATYDARDGPDIHAEYRYSALVTSPGRPDGQGDAKAPPQDDLTTERTEAEQYVDDRPSTGGPGGQGSRRPAKIGFIGDSLTLATHTNHMCENRSILACLENRLGVHDLQWSHGSGDKPWSLATLLGYTPEEIVNAAVDGAKWQDAFAQAQRVTTDRNVDTVVINMGSNDVCATVGHDYTGDLIEIAGHIDDVLTHLSDELPRGAEIHILSTPDIVAFRNIMVNRDHNHLFDSCQAAWDLDENKVKQGAALDACVDLFGGFLCELFGYIADAIDYLIEELLDYYFEAYEIVEGPCGKVLSSQSTDEDRVEAEDFNLALNELLDLKAAEYNGVNGLRVSFTWRIYEQTPNIKPYHVSRLDCFHPSRVGQMHLAMQVAQGWDASQLSTERVFFDAFDSQDFCNQEFTVWPGCWVDVLDGDPFFGDVQIENQQLMVRHDDTTVWRQFDLSGQTAAWLQIMYRRDDIGNDQHVRAEVSVDGGLNWTTMAYYDDGGDDGDHRGHHFDLSSFPFGSDMRLRFISSSGLGDDEKIYFDNIKIFSW